MQLLLADDAYSERLANHSQAFWRHWLSPSATNCAWRGLFRNYAKAQTFVPEWRPTDVSWASYSYVAQQQIRPDQYSGSCAKRSGSQLEAQKASCGAGRRHSMVVALS